MKNRLIILISLILLCLAVNAQENIFKVTPKFPNPGDRVKITYNTSNTPLKESKVISGKVYIFDNNHWIADDLKLTNTQGNTWEATITLPEHTGLITCTFENDSIIDKGGNMTYSWMLDKTPLSRFAWGLLRSPDFQDETPAIVDSTAMIEREVTMMWINNEMKFHPESRLNIFYEGLKLRQIMHGGNIDDRIKEEIAFLMEQDLNVFQQWKLQQTIELLANTDQSYKDSLETVIVAKYPKGVLSRDQTIWKLFRTADAKERKKGYSKFIKDFPKSKFNGIMTGMERNYLAKIIKAISYQDIVDTGSYDFIFDTIEKSDIYNLIDYSWHLVSIPYTRETMPIDSLKMFGDRIVPEITKNELIVPKFYQGKLTPSEWQKQLIGEAKGEYLTYARILEQTKDYDRSQKYLEKIKPFLGYSNADFNAAYTRMLLRNGNKEQATSYISESLKSNAVTPEMFETLKQLYIQNGGDPQNFENYLNSLRSKENEDEHRRELLSSLIDEPIESFTLESNKEHKVTLSEQKGSIVVLDFWATWCAPCKRAMPGMQMVSNVYAKDDKVKFYFVDTQETSKTYRENIQAFLKEKGYDFHVLYDAINPETGKMDDTYHKYSKAFSFSGIPQKMIIDQNGRLRWRSTGYNGSPSELADEIAIIIEYLKSE
ncbi:TlpA disulfide reductase family protein [Robertkochia solimangrovi]|uniref:TlpA disulfide reductase family protein n=1 Tax=Robertkochia solimangrovi TaxID=2213046 RepID=UPI00117CC7BA|nr:TlpA disulfide reductase family protein [Robertkochia solimangrovi]TRZ41294.1 hypothetical protein DMZ48_17855 [Robertkochia solimangrovi]